MADLYSKVYYEQNRERILERMRLYRIRNREKLRKQSREIREELREHWRDYHKEYYAKNRERIAAKAKERRDKIREVKFKCDIHKPLSKAKPIDEIVLKVKI